MPLLDSFAGDPAISLWMKASEAEVEKIIPFLGSRPVPVGNIAAALGLKVQSDALAANISGLIRKVSDAPARFEITVNVADAPVRQRFTVAHEIAHFLLHRPLIDHEGIIDTVLFRSNVSSRHEAEANKLSSSILLPWGPVRHWTQEHFSAPPQQENIVQIAEAYKVSELTVGYRFNF